MPNCTCFLKVIKKTYRNVPKNTILVKNFLSEMLVFCASDSLKIKQAFRSFALYHEQPEQFSHSRSFVLSSLSKSLTFAHLI